ncbi:MAG TPA: hypothetical protein DER60_02570, partial [Syntrophomonas sp.]|nr:hypothetical protein [Syntrophomonas sp.]
MKTAVSTAISLTMELGGEDRDREIFALSRYYYSRWHDQAKNAGLEEHIITVKNPGKLSPELMHLERQLYAYPHRTFPEQPAA